MKNKLVLLSLGSVLLFMAVLFIDFGKPDFPDEQDLKAAPVEKTGGSGPETVPPTASAVLVSGGGNKAVAWSGNTPAAHRARIVIPDASLFSPHPTLRLGDRLELALFDDTILTSKISNVTDYPNGMIGMTAQLEGHFKGTLYLSYSGNELRAHADVLGGNDFYVRYDSKLQAHVAIEVDRAASDYQGECETCLLELDQTPAAEASSDEPAEEELNEPAVAFDAPPDSVVVDVMVVYTPAARMAEGGVSGINNNIALAMQKANEALGNSNTKMTLNLVHSAETTYTESGFASSDLGILRYTGGANSAMDDVHTWRDTYNADMVCLLEDEPGTGGIGYLLNDTDGRPDLAFCIARVQQSDWTYTVAHEWGHNMGCAHSKTQSTQQGPGLYDYSAGWQWADTASSASIGYCSVMTYENFDSSGVYEYDRVAHFSNPDIDYTGNSVNATGHAADGDNARTIRNVRYVVADYRISNAPVSQFPSSNGFEVAYSLWKYYGSDIDWERNSGPTTSSSTGPSSAYDGSWYVYVESSGNGTGYPNKTALLQASFDFSALANPEISYAYHMYGSSMGSLYLEVSTNSGSSWNSIWSMSGDQGDVWNTTNISLAAYAGSTNLGVRFRGVTGANYQSDIALDAISVTEISTDIDGDGIPNTWEIEHFGGATNAVAGANPDLDSYTNFEEYIAGLNPNVVDGFGPSSLTVAATNWFEWTAVSGRLYSVYWSSNLVDGFSLLQSNISDGVFTDDVHSAESQGFYKLKVQLAP